MGNEGAIGPASEDPEAFYANHGSTAQAAMNLDGCAIAEQWNVLLPGCHEEGAGVLAAIEQGLDAAAVPGLQWSQESISTGVIKSLRGRRRDGLVLRYSQAPEWTVLIMANPFGASLHVTWAVVVAPSRMRDLRRSVRFGEEHNERRTIGGELDFFHRADLAAVFALSHQATKAAIEALSLDKEIPVTYDIPDEEAEDYGP